MGSQLQAKRKLDLSELNGWLMQKPPFVECKLSVLEGDATFRSISFKQYHSPQRIGLRSPVCYINYGFEQYTLKAFGDKRKLLHEVSILDILDGNYVPNLVDAGVSFTKNRVEQTIFFYVMSSYQGIPHFNAACKSVDEIVVRAIKLCDALDYIHTTGVVHLDIRSPNIFVLNKQVIIIDFGESLFLDSTKNVVACSESGRQTVCAPEQLDHTSNLVDGRADLYGVGSMLYEKISGVEPFSNINRLAGVVYPVNFSLLASAPARLAEIIRVSMEHLPANRFQSALEMKTAFESV